ncbi:MAG: 4Fe-4S dicluster domain-containing protein [Chloroflexi bacterium]|nr:4Fe-4S dicluster domain-containing protein [Chloroflexota bacterium]
MTQCGFFFDQSRCSGCQACAVACKSWNGLPPGPLKYLKIYEYEKGHFPAVRIHFQWVPCYHCEQPACVGSCPRQAIRKEDKYGAVLIDSEKCDGCRICYDYCPYGAPVFESDEIGVKARKCTMCFDRLEMGEKPICVMTCPDRALDFGPLDQLVARYGNRRDLEDLPSSQTTAPAVIFKPHAAKRLLVPYDAEKALKLMMRRDPLPPVFNSPREVTEIPPGMVGRSGLVIKHKSAADLMRHTRNDEG